MSEAGFSEGFNQPGLFCNYRTARPEEETVTVASRQAIDYRSILMTATDNLLKRHTSLSCGTSRELFVYAYKKYLSIKGVAEPGSGIERLLLLGK